jgi:hypothetical protein
MFMKFNHLKISVILAILFILLHWLYSGSVGFAQCPAVGAASNPNPVNGATNVSTSVTLSWSAASNATKYDVYFGTTASPPLVAPDVIGTSWFYPYALTT